MFITQLNYYFLNKKQTGSPSGLDGKESACNSGDLDLIPGLGISSGGGMQPTPVFLPRESPWTEEPGGLQSLGSQRVWHDWATKHSTAQHSILNRKFWLLMTTVEHSQLSAPGSSSYQDPKSFSSLCQTALSSVLPSNSQTQNQWNKASSTG